MVPFAPGSPWESPRHRVGGRARADDGATPRPDAEGLSRHAWRHCGGQAAGRHALTPKQLDTARTVIVRLDPKAASLLPQAAPAPLNAASNSIASAYQWLQAWVSYGVDLAQYVLEFIPFGYLIGNQIGIVYDALVVPISDSVVYGLIIPVVNDPLNLASYVNGPVAVGSTTVNALINVGIAEFNYFFGWLHPAAPPAPVRCDGAHDADGTEARRRPHRGVDRTRRRHRRPGEARRGDHRRRRRRRRTNRGQDGGRGRAGRRGSAHRDTDAGRARIRRGAHGRDG